MKNENYIKSLKNLLKDLDTDSRNQIIKEIESYIKESGVNGETLVEKFGTPEELASSYLEDIPIKKPESKSKIVKILFYIVAVFMIFIVGSIFLFNYITSDDFDYSTHTSDTINSKTKEAWVEVPNIKHLNLKQVKVVFYASANENLMYSCSSGTEVLNEQETLEIRQSKCFIKLPLNSLNIKTFQSNIVLIKPDKSLYLDLEQSTLRIAEKQNKYKYIFERKQSDIKGLESKESNINIKFKVYQSNISKYEYKN